MFRTSQTYFFQAVILLLQHDASGSYGVILNRATQYTLGQLTKAEALVPEFADNRLYLGGDVGHNSIQLLHSHGRLAGAEEVVAGVYMSGAEAAKKAVAEGTLPASDFRWYARYAGWGSGQLQRECDMGVWFTAAAAPGVVLDSTLTGPDMWHHVMELMGGDHAELSRNVRTAEMKLAADVQAAASATEGEERSGDAGPDKGPPGSRGSDSTEEQAQQRLVSEAEQGPGAGPGASPGATPSGP